ncbi:hypothetical protein GCM10009087_25340 [Sphingomonas oligophenolica]|uniref:TonB C-terminal domain-containing protein n=1 Tax=Sphingomonas oligophenolica TaxID=301154 RepID=A0ABU9Y9J5_9SPHN
MLAFLLLQAAAPVPTDWSALAPLPYMTTPRMTPPLARFVADEIAAGRCTLPKPADGHYVVKVDVATLVSADGMVRRAVPHAIDCPTVEQYSVGLVLKFARANLQPRAGTADIWYRATIVFDWTG